MSDYISKNCSGLKNSSEYLKIKQNKHYDYALYFLTSLSYPSLETENGI